jgi:two-component sensor histidine kinase
MGVNDGDGGDHAVHAARNWLNCETALIGSRISVAVADRDGRYTWLFNLPDELAGDIVGKLDQDFLPSATAGQLEEAKRTAAETGETQRLELELSGERGPRWFNVGVYPQYKDGDLVGTVTSLADITETKVQDEHLRIVLRELAHRSKNLLSVIQGIARQSADTAQSKQQFLTRFNGRLFSLSRAHDVLTDADWRGARIFDLVRSQIALFAEERIAAVAIEGENVFLRPNAAQYIGLALHELTTNALKYGALSRRDGTIVVRVERTGDGGKSGDGRGAYRFSWRETSSARRSERLTRSFGLLMLTEVVPASVSGSAELEFRNEGLAYALDISRSELLL